MFVALLLVAALAQSDLPQPDLAQTGTIHPGTPDLRMCTPGERNTSTKTCVVDGDTLWLQGRNYRLKDYDTPEPMTAICGGEQEVELAHRASERFLELLNSNAWTIEDMDALDRTGQRWLATIRIDGRDVGDILIEEHLARRWPDGEEWWC